MIDETYSGISPATLNQNSVTGKNNIESATAAAYGIYPWKYFKLSLGLLAGNIEIEEPDQMQELMMELVENSQYEHINVYIQNTLTFDPDYYSKKELDKVEIAKDYDPNSGDNMDFMDRDAILEKKGIAFDKDDGSTRCLAEYYWYCRDTV